MQFFATFQASKSPRLQTWFASSLGLLLHRSNVRLEARASLLSRAVSCQRAMKGRFSNAIDARTRPAHTGSRRGSWLVACVVGWWKNIHARFEVHSCYGSKDVSVLKPKFGNCTKLPLFSNLLTYYILIAWRKCSPTKFSNSVHIVRTSSPTQYLPAVFSSIFSNPIQQYTLVSIILLQQILYHGYDWIWCQSVRSTKCS